MVKAHQDAFSAKLLQTGGDVGSIAHMRTRIVWLEYIEKLSLKV